MGTGIPVVSFARSGVAELVRVSTTAQAKQGTTNIPAQKAANAITCERHGLEVIETIEIVESGTTSARSPEMLHILELCRTRQIKGIVIVEQSRLTRSMADWGMFDVFKKYDIKLYLPMGVIDLNTDAGVFMMTMNNAYDTVELGKIRTRTVGGKATTRQLGGYAGGALPLGLAYKKPTWSYTDDIETVREMFRLFLSGEERCISEIARRVGTKRPQVDHALRNPIYSGWLVYDEECDIKNPIRTEGRKNKYRRIKKEQPFRAPLPLEPVVSEEDFNEVQRIRDTARRAASNKRRKGELLYLNFVHCPCCHLPLYPKALDRGRPRSYYCRTRNKSMRKVGQLPCPTAYHPGPALDAVIDRVLAETLLDKTHLMEAIGGYKARIAQEWQALRPLLLDQTERRDALARRKARIRDAYVKGHYDDDASAYERDMQAVAAELATLDRVIQPSAQTPHELRVDDVKALLSGFQRWPFLKRADKRSVLEALEPFIVVDNDSRVTGIAIPLGDLAAPGGSHDSPRLRSRLIVAPPANPRSNNAYLYFDLAA